MVATGDIFIIVYVFLRDNKLKQMSIGIRPCRNGTLNRLRPACNLNVPTLNLRDRVVRHVVLYSILRNE